MNPARGEVASMTGADSSRIGLGDRAVGGYCRASLGCLPRGPDPVAVERAQRHATEGTLPVLHRAPTVRACRTPSVSICTLSVWMIDTYVKIRPALVHPHSRRTHCERSPLADLGF